MEWMPMLNEVLETKRKPNNPMDKYAVTVVKNDETIGHLRKGPNGKYAKTVFYFLRANQLNKCTTEVKVKPKNLGKGKRLASALETSLQR